MRLSSDFTNLRCLLTRGQRLASYVDGELTAEEQVLVQQHLSSCGRCRSKEKQMLFAQRALALVTLPSQQPLHVPAWVKQGFVRGANSRSSWRKGPISIAVTIIVIAVVAAGLWWNVQRGAPAPVSVQVSRLSGAPQINAMPLQRSSTMKKGERLSTDAWSTALIRFGRFGQIETEFNTDVELLESNAGEQRLLLKRGKIYASLAAPPRMFFVNTPAGTAIDMGCAYSLEVNDAGETLLEVVSGWVVLNLDKREALVPAGTACRARPGKGPGTPFLKDAAADLKEALNSFDFADGGNSSVDTVMRTARQKDSITLWYLLRKVDPAQRAAIFERLNGLVPVPQGVSRAGILELNEKMMQAWRESVDYASLGFDPRRIVFDHGTVRPTGSLNEARFGHTATLLRDGKLLVAGGFTNVGLNSAELFDPATEVFAFTGSMTAPRVGHTATLLKDGRVLIAGGAADNPFEGGQASAELYDPLSGAFTATGSMKHERLGHTATLLNDGRVLITGGVLRRGISDSSSEIYDPTKGIFTEAARLNMPRFDHTATLLQNGQVVIAGGGRALGADAAIDILNEAEIYDPVSDTFRSVPPMNHARHKHSAILMSDGRVLLMGGSDGYLWHGTTSSAEVFDPVTESFSITGQMATSRYKIREAVVALNNGKVLVAGGGERLEVYDLKSGIFTPVEGTIGAPRYLSTATLLSDGAVIIVGGYSAPPDKTGIRLLADAGAWIYTPGH